MLPENWDAMRVFCAAASQWRMGPSGHRVGLDYAAVRVVADVLGVALEAVFGRIQAMEAQALECWGAAT